jgi:hypothetical protein
MQCTFVYKYTARSIISIGENNVKIRFSGSSCRMKRHFSTQTDFLPASRCGFGYVTGLTFCLIGGILYATNAADAELRRLFVL